MLLSNTWLKEVKVMDLEQQLKAETTTDSIRILQKSHPSMNLSATVIIIHTVPRFRRVIRLDTADYRTKKHNILWHTWKLNGRGPVGGDSIKVYNNHKVITVFDLICKNKIIKSTGIFGFKVEYDMRRFDW